MDWKEYEEEITKHFGASYPDAKLTENAKKVGKFSKVSRQLDLLIEGSVCDFEFRIVVDGKYRNKPIDVNDVESFIGMLRDVEANYGVMISPEGYSTAAINRAHFDDLNLDLEVLNFKDLETFQTFGAFPYAGDCGVALPAPFGWIIDGGRCDEGVALLYQRGRNANEAKSAWEWMYINFWKRDAFAPDLQSLLAYQQEYLTADFPGAEFQFLQPVARTDGASTQIRKMRNPKYPAMEYTGFVEFKDFIFFCVMFTPKELENKNLRKLRYILQRVLPLRVKQGDSSEAD